MAITTNLSLSSMQPKSGALHLRVRYLRAPLYLPYIHLAERMTRDRIIVVWSKEHNLKSPVNITLWYVICLRHWAL